MAIVPLTVRPGVDTEKTRTLNEGAWSYSNLIRFFNGLAQKIGGWIKWTTFNVVGIPRVLHAWQSLARIQYLGVATQSTVYVLTANGGTDITPVTHSFDTDQFPITYLNTDLQTINIVDSDYEPPVGSFVTFPLPTLLAGGGTVPVLLGSYQVLSHPEASSYLISLPLPLSGAAGGFKTPTMPTLAITSGSNIATISNYPDHGYSVGNTFTLAVSQRIGTFTVAAFNYVVASVPSSSSFTFTLNSPSTATGSALLSGPGGVAGLPYRIYSTAGSGGGLGPVGLQWSTWTLDNWGEILIACPYQGSIYTWNPETPSNPMAVIANAPTTNIGAFVAMPEQILVAYGSVPWGTSTWNPLAICWSTVSDYTIWQPETTNQAGSFVLPSGSAIVRGLQAPQQMLFWTDIELWAGQYVGYPLVFGFNKIGQNCGLIAPNAVALMNNVIVWMSQNQFFMLNASGVQAIPCTVWDFIFQNLNTAFIGKICAAPNSYFNEVAWYFPSKDSTQENDSYVKVNLTTGVWDYGFLSRTAWIDQSILGAPIGSDNVGNIYQHEIGNDAAAQPITASIQTGYIMIAEGNNFTFVDQIYPNIRFGTFDAQINPDDPANTQKGTVMVTAYMTDYPGDNPRQYGPYPVDSQTQYIPLRARGRQMSLKFSSDDPGLFWRLGLIRYRGQLAGRR